jgi:hypothetical protein
LIISEKKNSRFLIHIIFLEKTNELIDSAKHKAHDASAKAQELEKTAEQKLVAAEKAGEQKFEETKQWVSQKGSEALEATQHAFAVGAAAVNEKVHQGKDFASETAAHVIASAQQLAADASAKASTAANVIAEKTVAAADTTAAAAQSAAATVKGKIFIEIMNFINLFK